jgi:hypothetical protein
MSSDQPGATLAYVVLHHTGVEHPHYDLMVDPGDGGMLWTWRVSNWPPEVQGRVMSIRVADHRRQYLEYEGAIQGDRGEVTKVSWNPDEGILTWQLPDGRTWQLAV